MENVENAVVSMTDVKDAENTKEENAESAVVLTTDGRDAENSKEESAEKDAILMTNGRDAVIPEEESTVTLVTDVKDAMISKADPVNLMTIRKRQKNKQL